MRSRRVVGASLALVVFLLPAIPVAAKGPGSATITGPGGTVQVSPGNFRYTDEDPYWDLQSESGVIELALIGGDELGERPSGALGEPLAATWDMGSRDVFQLLYLTAAGGPVTHIEPDPEYGVRGGWYKAGPGLATALEELGIDIPTPGPRARIARFQGGRTAGMIWKV